MYIHYNIVKNLINSPKTLAEIQTLTEASLPTVRRAVQTLSDAGWVRIVGQAEAEGGRPAKLFGINDETFILLGLHIQLPGMQLIATDLSGKILKKIDFFERITPDTNEAVRVIADYVQEINNSYPDRTIIGMGIASPGYIDLSTGDLIVISRAPTWINFPICRRIKEATGLPVEIVNDVDALAIAEFRNGNSFTNNNIAYVGYCEGLKASFFLNGKLYKGSLGNVGLVASDLINLKPEFSPEESKDMIYLAGFHKIFNKRVEQINGINRSEYQSIFDQENDYIRFTEILEKALEDEIICRPLMKDLTHLITQWVANMIYIIQPDVVVIGGLLSRMPKSLFTELESGIRSNIPPLIKNKIVIKQGVMEIRKNSAIGAIYHFLDQQLRELLENYT